MKNINRENWKEWQQVQKTEKTKKKIVYYYNNVQKCLDETKLKIQEDVTCFYQQQQVQEI